MTTNALSAFGTLLKRGDGGSPESFTTIAEITQGSGPAAKNTLADATTMDSPSRALQYIATVLDSGKVSADILFKPTDTTHADLLADQDAGTLRNFQLALPSGKTYSFAALVEGLSPAWKVGDLLKATLSLQISGDVTRS